MPAILFSHSQQQFTTAGERKIHQQMAHCHLNTPTETFLRMNWITQHTRMNEPFFKYGMNSLLICKHAIKNMSVKQWTN